MGRLHVLYIQRSSHRSPGQRSYIEYRAFNRDIPLQLWFSVQRYKTKTGTCSDSLSGRSVKPTRETSKARFRITDEWLRDLLQSWWSIIWCRECITFTSPSVATYIKCLCAIFRLRQLQFPHGIRGVVFYTAPELGSWVPSSLRQIIYALYLCLPCDV